MRKLSWIYRDLKRATVEVLNRDALKRQWAWYSICCYGNLEDNGPVEPRFIEFAVIVLKFLFLVYWCTIFDHNWEEHGYVNPDNGSVDMTCKRCGWSIHYDLY